MADNTADSPSYRKALIESLQKERGTKAIVYVTSHRKGASAQIAGSAVDVFVDHLDDILDDIGPNGRISLILQTRGGETPAAWRLVNLIRMFCDELEVITPHECMSAGTLIALGADRIVMTKQATLGPIDPSIQHPLSPQIPKATGALRCPVSVESVNS
ncbi:MAG: serine protease, partial [Betaproteobacteria bacterium]|nr:serine protease [Betaproteobacteria bacterium]